MTRLARVARGYRAFALLLLNAVVLVAALEGGARLVRRLGGQPADPRAQLEYYRNVDWGEPYWREFVASAGERYVPYSMWRRPAFEGQLINIDSAGVRATPGSRCTVDAFTIYAFGGSTMWGTGAPDAATIPALLLAELAPTVEAPLCVVNFGESAWVSSQGTAELIRQLRSGGRPDLVISYEGINDTFTALQSGVPAVHWDSVAIARRFEGSGPLAYRLDGWLARYSVFYRGLNRALGVVLPGRAPGLARGTVDPTAREGLQRAVVATYLTNLSVAEALGRSFGFRVLGFWQPLSVTGTKRLTPTEKAIVEEVDPVAAEFARGVYGHAHAAADTIQHLTSLIDVFGDVDQAVWIDWVHVNPDGNAIIARAMAPVVAQVVDDLRGSREIVAKR